MQDFEGPKLVERIAHYAVVELAVRWPRLKLHYNLLLTPDVLIQIFALFLGFLFQSINVGE